MITQSISSSESVSSDKIVLAGGVTRGFRLCSTEPDSKVTVLTNHKTHDIKVSNTLFSFVA